MQNNLPVKIYKEEWTKEGYQRGEPFMQGELIQFLAIGQGQVVGIVKDAEGDIDMYPLKSIQLIP